MLKHSEYMSISEFCKKNDIKTYRFYEMLNRSPELAMKIKTNSAGRRVLNENAMRTAMAIFRKDKLVDKQRSSAAREINTLRKQVLIFKLCKCIFPKELTILKIQSQKATLKNDLAQTVGYYDEGQRRINRCFSFIGYLRADKLRKLEGRALVSRQAVNLSSKKIIN